MCLVSGRRVRSIKVELKQVFSIIDVNLPPYGINFSFCAICMFLKFLSDYQVLICKCFS